MINGPQRLGKYELRQQLGRGNIGEVWQAYDLQLRRDVAIKILYPDIQSDPHFFARFTQEGQVLASLHHTNIVQVHDVAFLRPPQQGGGSVAYIVMEYIEGKTLADYITTTVRNGLFLSPTEIVYLFTSLGVAIDYAHQKGVVHGNLKPANILLDKRNRAQFGAGEPLLTDFGMARLVGETVSVGTPLYMSPEQAQGNPANNRSDIYALGVILYELCTGVQPFRDASSVAVMMQHISALPTPPSLINANIPPALSEVILRAMAKDTVTRFPMASLLATAIADAYAIQSTIKFLPGQMSALQEQEEQNRHETGQSSLLGVAHPQMKALSHPLQHSQPLPVVPLVPRITGKIPVTPSPDGEEATHMMPVTLPEPPRVNAQMSETGRHAALQKTVVMPISVPHASSPTPAIPPVSAFPRRSKGIFGMPEVPLYLVVAILLLILLVVGSIIGINVLTSQGQQSANSFSGHVFFEDDPLGHDDVMRVAMQNLPAPPAGEMYVLWIELNNHLLRVANGTSNPTQNLTYTSPSHANLLPLLQRVLVTTEAAGSQPSKPGTSVYSASFDLAIFPYVNNILVSTPALPANQSVALILLNTMQSMNDKAGSIVDSLQGTHDYGLATRQATRILEMLDGTRYAQQSGDLPPQDVPQLNTPIGLLSSPTTKGYLDIFVQQLDLLQQHAGTNSTLLQHLQNVRNGLSDLKSWLQKLHDYNVQLLKAANLSNPTTISIALQLKQLAADSYAGRTVPPHESPLPILGSAGALQAYAEAQYLATLDLHTA